MRQGRKAAQCSNILGKDVPALIKEKPNFKFFDFVMKTRAQRRNVSASG
jgi:hypothetical protein